MYDLGGENKRFTLVVGGGSIMVWPLPPDSQDREPQTHKAAHLQRHLGDGNMVGRLLSRFKMAMAGCW